MELNSLARTLAERLLADFAKPSANSMRYPHQLELAEAVIREAIDKTRQQTLEEAEQAVMECVVNSRSYFVDAIRSLKQSSSGKEQQ